VLPLVLSIQERERGRRKGRKEGRKEGRREGGGVVFCI
jgi:hypothetical protein